MFKNVYTSHDFNKLAEQNYFSELVSEGHISKEPDRALERIEAFFGQTVKSSGMNIEAICRIRDRLAKYFHDPAYANLLMVTAPHTHWETNKPITYSMDLKQDRYLVSQSVDVRHEYRPVSFVFTSDKILPYEWVDRTVTLDDDELHKAYEALEHVHRAEKLGHWPIGVTVDFRFKRSLLDDSIDTLEVESEIDSVLAIGKLDRREPGEDSSVQVSWPCRSFSPDPRLSENAYRIFCALAVQLDSIEDAVAKTRCLQEMEADLLRA